MSTATRGRHISGRSQNFGSAAHSQSPHATRSQSHTVDDTTTIPTSEHPTDDNTNLSEHESTLTTDDREQEPVRKRLPRFDVSTFIHSYFTGYHPHINSCPGTSPLLSLPSLSLSIVPHCFSISYRETHDTFCLL